MPELVSGDNSKDQPHQHLEDCAECAGLMDRQRRLVSGLGNVAKELRAVGAPLRVEANLMEAFRRENMHAAPPRARIHWMPALSWATAVAAALIGLGVLTAPHWRRASVPASHQSAGSTVELASSLADDVGQDAGDDDGFIPLPNTQSVGPDDDVHVVRMELPRSAMLVVGLDVSPDRASEPVQAEVMLGPDGLARAVRFDTDGTN